MQRKLILSLLIMVSMLNAYEIADENEILTRTCRITVKVQVLPDEQMKKTTGRALIIATLTDDEKNPYRQEHITFSANVGTFTCRLPEDTTALQGNAPDQCFTTGFDGNAKVYLVNIPLNTSIRVTASYICDDRTISSNASMSISRATVKKKKRVVVH